LLLDNTPQLIPLLLDTPQLLSVLPPQDFARLVAAACVCLSLLHTPHND